MKFDISILESNTTIRNMVLQNISDILNFVIDKSIPILQKEVVKMLIEALMQEPEYNSLKNGLLRSEFGIPDTSVVDDIVIKLANTTTVTKNPLKINNFGITGGLNIVAIKSDNISGLINDTSGMVNDSARGYSLPWLEWLLLKGNEIIVKKYSVKFGDNASSRSGNAIMVSSDKNWRVPSEFSGTPSDNWTTRAITRIEDNILKLIQKTLESNI